MLLRDRRRVLGGAPVNTYRSTTAARAHATSPVRSTSFEPVRVRDLRGGVLDSFSSAMPASTCQTPRHLACCSSAPALRTHGAKQHRPHWLRSLLESIRHLGAALETMHATETGPGEQASTSVLRQRLRSKHCRIASLADEATTVQSRQSRACHRQHWMLLASARPSSRVVRVVAIECAV